MDKAFCPLFKVCKVLFVRITLLSDTVVRMSDHDEPVVFYKLDSDDVSRDIAVMWKKKRYVSKAMEEFTKLAAEMFSG